MNNSNKIFATFGKKSPDKQPQPLCFDDPWLMVRKWYATDLGQALLHCEQRHLSKLLEQVFGYNLVQLGCLDEFSLTEDSRTCYQFVLESLSYANQANPCTHTVSSFADLALQNQSVDAVVLPHTLEFEQNPHQILREVERVLVAEGKAIFLGFNPYSLWGLWHKYWEVRNRTYAAKEKHGWEHGLAPLPSCGHLISQRRLCDWLQLLGFDIELVNEYFYRPPISRSGLLNKLEFMEQAGEFSRLLPAGGYLLIAIKRVSTLTPIRQKWKLPKTLIGSDTIEPARYHCDKHYKKNHS